SLLLLRPPPPPVIYTLSLHDALPISGVDDAGDGQSGCKCGVHRLPAVVIVGEQRQPPGRGGGITADVAAHRRSQHHAGHVVAARSEEHTSELQSRENLVCRLLLEKKK